MKHIAQIVALSMLLLNGCTTAALWDKHDSGKRTEMVRHEQGDKIVGFARVKANSQQLPPNSLVMLGEQYVYVLQTAAATDGTPRHVDLAKILNAKLSQAFELHALGASSQSHAATRLQGFPVQLNPHNPSRFQSAFCLHYPENPKLAAAERRREQVELDNLHFRTIQNANSTTRIRCMVAVGTIYTKPNSSLKADYRFTTSLPVTLETTEYREMQTGKAGTVWRTLLTPFTAALDIVSLPITVPLAIKAAQGMSENGK